MAVVSPRDARFWAELEQGARVTPGQPRYDRVYELYRELEDCIPNDHCRQVNYWYYVESLLNQRRGIKQVMDLGSGGGRSLDYLGSEKRSFQWIGLDIESSHEVDGRTRTDGEFHTFDGIHIPFEDGRFDLIYSGQVFEHVRHPAELLREVCRVLAPEGRFVGSTSQFEAFHSRSLWNYTPYGFRLLLETAGLRLLELRPGIDALTLIARRMLGRPRFFSRWWRRESPLNRVIDVLGRVKRAQPSSVNAAKLLYCGQFSFMATKDGATS